MLKKIFFLFLLSGVLFLASCTRERPILNLQNQPVAQELSAKQVKKCMELAGISRGWQMQTVKPGLIHGTISTRGHYAVVNIPYSNHGYSIEYQSSVNLLEKNGYIHRNYNRWISSLNQSIVENLAKEQRNNYKD